MKELTRRNILTSALGALFAVPFLAGGRKPPTSNVATAVASGEPNPIKDIVARCGANPYASGRPVQSVDFYSDVTTIECTSGMVTGVYSERHPRNIETVWWWSRPTDDQLG